MRQLPTSWTTAPAQPARLYPLPHGKRATGPRRQFRSPTRQPLTRLVNTFFADASNGDLHLRRTALATLNPFENLGTPLGSITTDADNDTRDGSAPDIGADEVITMQFSAATYSVAENVGGGLATITVNRTAGSGNFTIVDYATSNGTAVGGASCGGATDYVTVPVSTFSFAPGQTVKTFNVAICSDGVVEDDETINLAPEQPDWPRDPGCVSNGGLDDHE